MEAGMIDHIIFDVDGTLTDGGVIYSANGVESKQFNIKDGLILSALPSLGFTTIFLTGRNSEETTRRAKELKVTSVLQDISNKAEVLQRYLMENNLSERQFAYVGDDLNDYTAMKLCTFKACPADAALEVQKLCDYVSTKNGGHGAVRDICEFLLRKQGQYDQFIALYNK